MFRFETVKLMRKLLISIGFASFAVGVFTFLTWVLSVILSHSSEIGIVVTSIVLLISALTAVIYKDIK